MRMKMRVKHKDCDKSSYPVMKYDTILDAYASTYMDTLIHTYRRNIEI